MKNLIALFGLVLLLTAVAQAQDDRDTNLDALFDMSLEELMAIDVVSSSKDMESKEVAPNVITVYPQMVLDQFNWTSLNDVLYRHQGFYPSQDFDRRTVGYRGNAEGWNNNHLLLLVDGIPFNDNLYGTSYTWEITPLFFTRTVELIRGPGAALYGSSATNGVLTLNTLDFSDLNGKHLIARSQYGERNSHIHDVLTGLTSQHVDVTVSASYRQTDGIDYQSYDASGRLGDDDQPAKFQVPDERQSYYVFAKLKGKNKLKGLSLQYHRQGWDYKTGHGWLWQIPDQAESMTEHRDMVVAKYEHQGWAKLVPEVAARYQVHHIDWDMWYYPTGAFDNFYPDGVNEYLKTKGQDLFTRLQVKFNLRKGMRAIVGLEPSIFFYNGDDEHYANADLNDEQDLGYAPYAENRQLGHWFEYIDGKTLTNIGSFAQFSSGQLLGERFKMVLGLRYDNEFFDYVDINDEQRPVKQKTFDQLSPRFALIGQATDKLTIKLLGGRAFRAPAPTEMFGANTWTLASNIDELQSEEITTFELELNAKISKQLHLNLTGFHTRFDGQIAYSIGNNNLSTNIYDLTNAGAELALTYTNQTVYSFLNVSYAHRLDETIYEAEKEWVSEHPDELTWAPAFVANFGLSKQLKAFQFAVSGHYQGEALRRDKDRYSQSEYQELGFTSQPRAEMVSAWFTLDAKVGYTYDWLEIGLSGKNLLDSDRYLTKSLKYPFDYKMTGRRLSLYLKIFI